MKCRSVALVRCGFFLTLAALSCTAGCKSVSGWKMPSLFSSREPDADKLAGRVDTPPSPAEKYTPSTIASKSPTGTATTAQTTKTGGLPYGNNSTTSYGATAPTGGLAAQSNGYQTGPYTTNVGASSASGASKPLAGANNSLVSTPTGSNASQGFVSPYGGSYSGVGSTSTPNVATSAGQLPLNSTPNSTALNNAPMSYGLPPYGSTPALGTVPDLTSAGVPDYPSMQNSMVSGSNSLPINPSVSSVPAYPSINTPLGSATAVATSDSVGVAPAVSAYQSALPPGSYTPGTTGRSTNYDFGPPPTTPTTTTTPTQTRTLPPNTASGQQLLIR